MRLLLTGSAGFIGWKTCEFLLKDGHTVIGIDNLNDYYDVRLKKWRLQQLYCLSQSIPLCERETKGDFNKYVILKSHGSGSNFRSRFSFHKIDIEDYKSLKNLFSSFKIKRPFDAVINLAARAGVRYSMVNPHVYYTTNVLGNLNLLELCREFGIKKYVFASTSSLYAGQKMPFKETLAVNEPISPYAASKKAAEVTCYTYHKLYGLDVSIVRYFTVYGPAGRPDMSIFRFISWVDKGKSIIMYGNGKQTRDFTYVDDIARGTIAAIRSLGFEIINLGNDHPHQMLECLKIIHAELKRQDKLHIHFKPFHPADISATWADITKAKKLLKWHPQYSLKQGLRETVKWYVENKQWVEKIKIDMKV